MRLRELNHGAHRPRPVGGSAREALTGAPWKTAGALGRAGLWLFPARRAPPAEDATPEIAAFGDQAPRAAAGATAGRTARSPATPAYGRAATT
jgi:hypothetical protein